jgi:hypothetical protein
VADVFETPLSFLMDAANHERHEREFRGALRAYYAMPHNGRYIWGATAGMLKSLYDRLYGAGEVPKTMAQRVLIELLLFLIPFAVFLVYRAASRDLKIRDRWPLTRLVLIGAGIAIARR